MTILRVLKPQVSSTSVRGGFRLAGRVAAALCACAALMEAIAFGAATALVQRNLLYHPPSVQQFAHSGNDQDPILGWPSKRALAHDFDEHGARVDPFFPPPHEVCISVYGGTFAYGAQVSDEKTWSALLSQHLGCRVANYGVAGYGTDQAYLRYSINRADIAPVVVLTFFSGDIRRNVNQFRNLLSANTALQMKPRFVFEEGLLTYVPPPRVLPERATELILSPGLILPYEYFLPGGVSGVIEATFPYTFAVGKLLLSQQLQARMHRRPEWLEFYDPSHSSKALQVTVGIIERFVVEAKQRSQEPVIALAPEPFEVVLGVARGQFVYESLKRELLSRGIEVFDVGERILDLTRDKNPCFIASGPDCSGVLSDAGHRLFASIISGMFQGPTTTKIELLQASAASERVG